MHQSDSTIPDSSDAAVPTPADEYEAPRIETVMTPAELERAVLYGGTSPVVCA